MIYENALIDWIKSKLELVTLANGFNSDIGLNLFLGGNRDFGECDTKPLIALYQLNDNVISDGQNKSVSDPCNYVIETDYRIDVWFDPDDINPDSSFNIIKRDIKRSIFLPIKLAFVAFGSIQEEINGVTKTSYVGSTTNRQEPSANVAFGSIFIKIKYNQDLADNDIN